MIFTPFHPFDCCANRAPQIPVSQLHQTPTTLRTWGRSRNWRMPHLCRDWRILRPAGWPRDCRMTAHRRELTKDLALNTSEYVRAVRRGRPLTDQPREPAQHLGRLLRSECRAGVSRRGMLFLLPV